MGPKKEVKKAGGEEEEGTDPAVLLSNYTKFCKLIGLSSNPIVTKNLTDEEKFPAEQLLINDEHGPLGPGGTRALMTALMGTGQGMKGGPYKLMKSLRFWNAGCNDDGAAAIAEVLRLGGGDVKISFLEIIDCNIGPKGAAALGKSLSRGNNLSLLTLKLDYNFSLGNEGLQMLCKGLVSNITLKQLHLQFCNITEDGGEELSSLLESSKSVIEVLNLTGNKLTGVGLAKMCKGLLVNKKLQTLSLADNRIDSTDKNLNGLALFTEVLMKHEELSSVDLMFNGIGDTGATILKEAITDPNCKVKEFLVDMTISMPLYEEIFKKGGGKKGKGKKGKKKK